MFTYSLKKFSENILIITFPSYFSFNPNPKLTSNQQSCQKSSFFWLSKWNICTNRVRRKSSHHSISLAEKLRMFIQWVCPLRYSETITGVRCKRGFMYTTTLGFCRVKSSNFVSTYSRTPRDILQFLQNLIVTRCSWQTYLKKKNTNHLRLDCKL